MSGTRQYTTLLLAWFRLAVVRFGCVLWGAGFISGFFTMLYIIIIIPFNLLRKSMTIVRRLRARELSTSR